MPRGDKSRITPKSKNGSKPNIIEEGIGAGASTSPKLLEAGLGNGQ